MYIKSVQLTVGRVPHVINLSQHKNGHDLVEFKDIVLKFNVKVAECIPQ